MPASVVQKELSLHGHRITYRTADIAERRDAPVILLVHGIAGNAGQWDQVIPRLAEQFNVVAPDLLGHGQSAKPRGDYSLGAYAVGLRDLLLALEHGSATVVGHSLGGGVAMQFAYAYPTMCERLVLVSSGGLGKEVHGLLKAVTWPGAEWVLPLLTARPVHAVASAVSRQVARTGLHAGPDVAEMLRAFGSLTDPRARKAFIHTIRAVIDVGGQRVSARDRLYLAQLIPTMVVWGRRDPIIPATHGEHAHSVMPGSRLEIFDGVGHFPQVERPDDLARVLLEFAATTEPAHLDLGGEDLTTLRRMLTGGPSPTG
ncbi:MAG TPA: alpha/beta fold hydrolase [Frankiaceae bacterium]|nr:alpha/beta fold hydrolase [Frankiaceae bacterium]